MKKKFKPSKRDLLKQHKKLYAELKEEYEELGAHYEKTGDEFWIEAEESSVNCGDYARIMSLRMKMNMVTYLMKKYG